MMRIKPWLQLVRLPNVFTAVADVAAGYWLVSTDLFFSARLGALCLASACLYAFGIVLNDLADVEVDRRERPTRPLPSGRISITGARWLAFALAVIALAACALAGFDDTVESPGFEQPGYDGWPVAIAAVLIVAIASYDLLTKGTVVGPLNMGVCRGLNILLGMCAGWWLTNDLGLLVVGAMTLYVASLTYFGVKEVEQSSKARLATGGLGVLGAILLLGFLIGPNTLAAAKNSVDHFIFVMWLAFLIQIGRVALRAARAPNPLNVQRAMKTFVLGIIVFDAIVAAAAQGWSAAGIILALLLPAMFAGRWVYST